MVTKLMIFADGRVDEFEQQLMMEEALRLRVPEYKLEGILKAADRMKPSDAFTIVSGFNPEEKKYVAALLGALMAIDKDVDDKELALWALVTRACLLPKMTLNEAVKYIDQEMSGFLRGR